MHKLLIGAVLAFAVAATGTAGAAPPARNNHVTGTWIGVSPEGVIFNPLSDVCASEADLTMDLI